MTFRRLLNHRLTDGIAVVMLVISVVIPVLNGPKASAAQLTERRITIATSRTSTATTHAVSFDAASTTAIRGIVVQYCVDSPIVGISCSTTNGVTGSPTTGTVSVTLNGGTATAFNVHASSAATGLLKIQHATGFATIAVGDTIAFNISLTNPSATGTFYARILTYSGATDAQAYTATAPGSYVDQGGVALSTANQLTITARVQEVLQFCVGTTLANPGAASCTDMSGTTIDLGVVDSSSVTQTADGAGKAMVRTNAVNGATVGYFAEQNTSSGKLKVPGATCSGTSTTDQCFNSAGTTAQAIVAGTELFGMRANAMDTTNGTTTNVVRDAVYNTANYAWDDTGTLDMIASSAGSSVKVIDDEVINLKFAATASVTTPTGAYTVTATFIATATF